MDLQPSCLSQVTLETTIGNKNSALWKYVQPQGCVLEWIRNIVANRLALDGATWAEVFKRFNSGTCVHYWPRSPIWGPFSTQNRGDHRGSGALCPAPSCKCLLEQPKPFLCFLFG